MPTCQQMRGFPLNSITGRHAREPRPKMAFRQHSDTTGDNICAFLPELSREQSIVLPPFPGLPQCRARDDAHGARDAARPGPPGHASVRAGAERSGKNRSVAGRATAAAALRGSRAGTAAQRGQFRRTCGIDFLTENTEASCRRLPQTPCESRSLFSELLNGRPDGLDETIVPDRAFSGRGTVRSMEQKARVAAPSRSRTITHSALPRSNQIDATLFELIS